MVPLSDVSAGGWIKVGGEGAQWSRWNLLKGMPCLFCFLRRPSLLRGDVCGQGDPEDADGGTCPALGGAGPLPLTSGTPRASMCTGCTPVSPQEGADPALLTGSLS